MLYHLINLHLPNQLPLQLKLAQLPQLLANNLKHYRQLAQLLNNSKQLTKLAIFL